MEANNSRTDQGNAKYTAEQPYINPRKHSNKINSHPVAGGRLDLRARKPPRKLPRPQQQQQQPSKQNSTTQTKTNHNATQNDHHLTISLRQLCTDRQLIEESTGMRKRRRVLNDLEQMLVQWSHSLYPPHYTLPADTTTPTPPALLSFGSYRLGVHTPDADVDCLVLAPPHVTRDNFFSSWVDILKADGRVSELHPVASAYTPVIKFQMDGVKIDLIFARVGNSQWLRDHSFKKSGRRAGDDVGGDDDRGSVNDVVGDSTATINKGYDGEELQEIMDMELDDTVLVGLDETSVRSVNGVRVAQFLISTAGTSAERLQNFRLTLRAVKEWARVHGLYSNVLGFLGGVNWAILVCWVFKRNLNAPASKLLHLFFRTFANWKWPSPVRLSNQQRPPDGVNHLSTWNPRENFRDAKHLMPIITPCYPSMNSSYNVGEPQLRRIRDEFWYASKLMDKVYSGKEKWNALFESNGFFDQHQNYLQVKIKGSNEGLFLPWFGFCESRLRILIAGLESPATGVQAYPYAKFFHTREDGDYVASFFIALRFSNDARQVKFEPLVSEYLHTVNSWNDRVSGMDLTMNLVQQNRLPSFVFSASMPNVEANKNDVYNTNDATLNQRDADIMTNKANLGCRARSDVQSSSTDFASPLKKAKLT